MNSLQKKGHTFQWTAECKQSFEKLKHLLTTAPVLKVADLESLSWFAQMKAKRVLEGVLTQEGKVISYES